MAQILIVEDEHDIANTVAKYLQADGFTTHIIDDGAQVVDWVRGHQPLLILLDLMLPGVDGVTLCKKLRQFTDVPVIITTAKVDEIDRLTGFDSGADDYVCKPYSARELVARVKAMLRRVPREQERLPEVQLQGDRLEVCYGGQCAVLTAVEFRLLELFSQNPERIYSREQIMDRAYKDFRVLADRTVDSHIRNLRRKLKPLGLDQAIQSIYGEGYKYVPPQR